MPIMKNDEWRMTNPAAIGNLRSKISTYNHARHEPVRRVLRWMVTNIGWRVFARIDPSRISGLENLPAAGLPRQGGAQVETANHV